MAKEGKSVTQATRLFFLSLFAFALFLFSAFALDYGNGTYGNSTYGNDTIAPKITGFSCTPASVTVDGTITCSCTAVDESGVDPTISYTTNPSTSTAGTFTTSCTATDTSSNQNSSSVEYTVTAAVTTGDSGGGPTGGGNPNTRSIEGQFQEGIWTSINTGETATLPVKNGAIGITQIEFLPADTVYGVTLKVSLTAQKDLPTEVPSYPDGKVYKYVKIEAKNINMMKDATISFKVTKKWVADNQLGAKNVALYRYENGWNKLETMFDKEDDTYAYYKAKTIKFSYFTIAESKEEAPVAPPADETAGKLPDEVEETPAAEGAGEEAPVEEEAPAKPFMRWIWWVVAGALVVVLAAYYMRYNKRKRGFAAGAKGSE